MVYCNATEKAYLEANLKRLTNKCGGCFLYDVHDPTSCAMGAVYMLSNFGGGADPWLFVSVLFRRQDLMSRFKLTDDLMPC